MNHGCKSKTRMHSSMMRPPPPAGWGGGGLHTSSGGVHPPAPPSGRTPTPLHGGMDVTTPSVDRMAHACENITFPILRMRAVIIIDNAVYSDSVY